MRRFKSPSLTQRFLAVHGVVLNQFRLGRHCIRAMRYRTFRDDAFEAWRRAVCDYALRKNIL